MSYQDELSTGYLEPATAPVVLVRERDKTKNDAEMELNDLPFEQLPPVFCRLIVAGGKTCKTTRYGSWIRDNFRQEFETWFSEAYGMETLKEVPCFGGRRKPILVKK